ncbi:MAG: ABC transporter transmembrane domain-containing protein [Candidatus Puniceispirillaceae bacterium]
MLRPRSVSHHSLASSEGDDKEASLSSLRFFIPYALAYRGKLIGAALSLVMVSGAMLSMGRGLGYLVDKGLGAGDPAILDQAVIVTVVIAAILAFGSYLRASLVNQIGEAIVADIKKALFSHLVSLHTGWFETARTGDLLSRINTDTTVMQTVLTSSLSMAIRNLMILIGGIILLIIASPKMSLVVGLVVPTVVVPVIYMARRLRKASKYAQDKIGDVSVQAEESLSSMRLIHAFGQETQQQTLFASKVEEALKAALRRVHLLGILSGTVIFLVFCGIGIILWIGGQDLLAGTISAGDLSAFIFYAFLIASATGSLSELGGGLQRAAGAADRVAAILQTKNALPQADSPKSLPQPDKITVSLDNVGFSYPARDDSALNNITTTIQAGERIALVGPSGAGKSTLFHLLLRFYDPKEGTIRFNGVDSRQLAFSDLRAAIGLVPQEPALFSASLYENISFGSPGADMASVRQAAQKAEILSFIDDLPDGFDTFVGEKGIRLSGGQKQRIAIARVMLRNPHLLLLDEATSALDSVSEAAVQKALTTLMEGRTSIVIAHRLSTIIDADRLLLIDKGNLIAQGTHESLLATSPLYRELALHQFG